MRIKGSNLVSPRLAVPFPAHLEARVGLSCYGMASFPFFNTHLVPGGVLAISANLRHSQSPDFLQNCRVSINYQILRHES